jgi:hypothetical protein
VETGCFFVRPLDSFFKLQDKGGQYGEGADETAKNSLAEHNAQVCSDFQLHEHQHHQPNDGGKRTTNDSARGTLDGSMHGHLAVIMLLSLLTETVDEHDAVIHGEHQLKDAYQ